jgi:tRNA modification GTPase
MTDRTTIFALSTASGRAGLAVVRISGPAAGPALKALGGPENPIPRQARLVRFESPEDGRPLDQGLALWFPGPRSFTGEDLVELHLHGGRAVVGALLEALGRLPALRPAEPGEFTRRAFDNGKLDLSEVEGLADLIAAETEAQRRQALRQMSGALSETTEAWRARLLRVLAHLEATLDFPDEDLPVGIETALGGEVATLAEELAAHLDDRQRGERLRDGFQIVILGAPNVGKSSLLNAIARRDAAIVSETAGTTRDLIEVHLDLGGYPVTLTDTAGLRAGSDPAGDGIEDAVEMEGMRRAKARAAAADLKLVVAAAPDWPRLDGETESLLDDSAWLLLNKIDLSEPPRRERHRGRPLLAVSARTGAGLADLLARLEAEAVARLGVSGAAPAVTRQRHRAALEDCRAALLRAGEARSSDLRAEDLRLAVRALGRITGRVDAEEVLDVIFRDFCIGK